jgi:hypothetical protein
MKRRLRINTNTSSSKRYHNEKLTEFIENNNELVRIIEYGRLFQKIDPIYLDPVHSFIRPLLRTKKNAV